MGLLEKSIEEATKERRTEFNAEQEGTFEEYWALSASGEFKSNPAMKEYARHFYYAGFCGGYTKAKDAIVRDLKEVAGKE